MKIQVEVEVPDGDYCGSDGDPICERCIGTGPAGENTWDWAQCTVFDESLELTSDRTKAKRLPQCLSAQEGNRE